MEVTILKSVTNNIKKWDKQQERVGLTIRKSGTNKSKEWKSVGRTVATNGTNIWQSLGLTKNNWILSEGRNQNDGAIAPEVLV